MKKPASISRGQLMFLVNKLSKMKDSTPLGSRIAEVHNGSSLFTGDAGQGESNIRRWVIENDWLEAIIALPLNMFYNTGIATYIWVLTNRKPEHRRGKAQLIDATQRFAPLRKNLGKKNCELSEDDIRRICDVFLTFEETEASKIFPNEAFGYWKITVERPLRLSVDLSAPARERFRRECEAVKEEPLANVVDRVAETIGPGPHANFNIFMAAVEDDAERHNVKLIAKRKKFLQTALGRRDELAEPVIRTQLVNNGFRQLPLIVDELAEPLIRNQSGPMDGEDPDKDAIYGRYHVEVGGEPAVVEYEPDAELRDTEQVPLLEEGGVEAFFRREVLPHVADAWIDETATKIGYEISFTRYFYKPQPMRTLEEIKADIHAIESENEGLLEQIVGAR
jgi:type I restriction enzyme M protein